MNRYDSLLSTGVLALGIASFLAVFGLRGGFDQPDRPSRGTPAPARTEVQVYMPQESPRTAPGGPAPSSRATAPRQVSEAPGEATESVGTHVRPTRPARPTASPTQEPSPQPEPEQPSPEPVPSTPQPQPDEGPAEEPEQNVPPLVEQISDQ